MTRRAAADWTGDLTRARRLQILQLVVVALLGLGVVLAGFVLGGRILSEQRHVASDQRQARELHRLRGELREGYAIFLKNRSEGRNGIDANVQRIFTNGLITIGELRRGHTDAPTREAIARVDVALGTIGRILGGDYSDFAIGSPEDQRVVRESIGAIDELDAAALAWANRASEVAEAHNHDLESLTRQLIGWLAAVVGLFGAAGIAIALMLARGRARIVDALHSEHDARGAVIASVQDGLAVVDGSGRIVDLNDRLSEVTGRATAELLAADDVPYLRGSGIRHDLVGERDLTITRPDGAVVPVILTSSPLSSPDGAADGHVHVVKDVTDRKRAELQLRSLAREQAALRRAATAVASGSSPEEVFRVVAREVAVLLGATGSTVSRFERENHRAVPVGSWLDTVEARFPERLPLEDNVIATVYTSGIPARTCDPADEPHDVFARHGFPVSICAPVRVGDAIWGGLTAVSTDPEALPSGSEVRLARFAELVGITVANADARERLARQAATDALTGLANHRTFHERLQEEVAAAEVSGRPLALAVFDLDHFKAVNDAYGHQTGDAVLAEFGRRLAAGARFGEIVARIGGEEFAWILPDSDGPNAWRAAERVREAYGAVDHAGPGRQTVSAGVCDLAHAGSAEALLRLADGALYWAKSHGRDNTTLYVPEVVSELSDAERAERLKVTQAKSALEALARAIDTKDPATARHTERVSMVSAAIAARLGWPAERVKLLHEAALYHDVGKIGIPDALMFKAEALTPDELDQVRSHAKLGAELVADVLTAEQVTWIRGHHENWDGSGYPDGLAGNQIPEGAQIIHVADAWDAMTSGRVYQGLRSLDGAVAECRRQVGGQFSHRMVETLFAVVEEQLPPSQGTAMDAGLEPAEDPTPAER